MAEILQEGQVSESEDILPAGSFHARGNRPLTSAEVVQIIHESTLEAVQGEDDVTIETARTELAVIFGSVMRGQNMMESINSWSHLVSAHVNREQLKIERPDIGGHIDGVAHVARTKIALALHPEKIEELAALLREKNLTSWNVNTFRKEGWIRQKHWFSNNVRAADGTIDWHLIAQKVHEIYPSEFTLKRARENFTLESALAGAREIADRAVALKGHWHPAGDIEEADKQLYMNLVGRAEFRRPANRPDINHRKNSRPNWYKIAEAMGEQYVATMVLSQKGNEPLFRDFNDAVDELGDLLNELSPETWSWHLVEQNYSALYAWFKNHVRTDADTVDTKRITSALPEPWASGYWQDS